jgi:NADPH:quinone reductase-like Zn-dependent oxidoreductase
VRSWHFFCCRTIVFRSGLLKPKYKVLGADVAGRVESVGRNVKQFQPGDEVSAPVIDSSYPLSEVPTAIRYLEEGPAQGKIVITD